MKRVKLLLMLAAISIFTAQCTKEGPAGPSGKDGVNGVDGANGDDGKDGADGEDGRDGNANVYSSDWFTLTWEGAGTTTPTSFKEAPEVTSDIMNTGVVLVYFRWYGEFPARMMPATIISGTTSSSWLFSLAVPGRIEFEIWSNISFYPSGSNEFRYVVIPSTAVAEKGYSKDILEKMSYEKVADIFDIHD